MLIITVFKVPLMYHQLFLVKELLVDFLKSIAPVKVDEYYVHWEINGLVFAVFYPLWVSLIIFKFPLVKPKI